MSPRPSAADAENPGTGDTPGPSRASETRGEVVSIRSRLARGPVRAKARTQALTTHEQVEAVFRLPALYRLGELITQRPAVGRPAAHPGYLLLGYGVLARVYRSGARVERELAEPATWDLVRRVVAETLPALEGQLEHGLPPLPGRTAPNWSAWKNARNRHLSDPDILDELRHRFTEEAVAQAREMGLLDPKGPGSWCHPDRSNVVYGDGTVIRPLYREPAARRERDPKTGEDVVVYLDPDGNPIPAPTRRFDPDAADFHGHTGSVHGQNYVNLYVRGEQPHQRVVLSVGRVEAPGREAETAVALIKHLCDVAGDGIKAVAYDGAFRGTHIDDLAVTCGLLTINKVAQQPSPRGTAPTTTPAGQKDSQRRRAGKRSAASAKWFVLGLWEHLGPDGPCSHQVAAVAGAVSETGLDDAGQAYVRHRLERRQVKRVRRSSGRWHFSVAYAVPCPHADGGSFLAWICPHSTEIDTSTRTAENVRVIAAGEADFARLYPVRSDAESHNAHLKRTLLFDRAMSLGGTRQLIDVLAYGLLHNAITAHHARVQQQFRNGRHGQSRAA